MANRLKLKLEHVGSHVEVRVFAGPVGSDLAHCGLLVMRPAEADTLAACVLLKGHAVERVQSEQG